MSAVSRCLLLALVSFSTNSTSFINLQDFDRSYQHHLCYSMKIKLSHIDEPCTKNLWSYLSHLQQATHACEKACYPSHNMAYQWELNEESVIQRDKDMYSYVYHVSFSRRYSPAIMSVLSGVTHWHQERIILDSPTSYHLVSIVNIFIICSGHEGDIWYQDPISKFSWCIVDCGANSPGPMFWYSWPGVQNQSPQTLESLQNVCCHFRLVWPTR